MSEPTRIYIWGMPRTLSTAFGRAMRNRTSCKEFAEPWAVSYYFSADRISDRFKREDFPDNPKGTFSKVKELLEGPFEGCSEVFVKEMVYRLRTFIDAGTVEEILPKGYIHTFLIRHPAKAVASMYQIVSEGKTIYKGFRAEECCYDEYMWMYKYVTETLGQKSIIVDADDLQADPEETLKLYCRETGIDFQDSMIQWKPFDEEQKKPYYAYEAFMKTFVESTHFLKKTPTQLPDVKDLPEEVQKVIEDDMPIYNFFYEKRLKPQ